MWPAMRNRKKKAISNEFLHHNLITLFPTQSQCPVVTSSPSPSGVTTGHSGGAPGRKCDPAALGLCVALSLPPRTLCATARTSCHCSHSAENNFLFQLFVAIFVWTKAPRLTFLQMQFGNRPLQGVFPRRFLFPQKYSIIVSHGCSCFMGIFTMVSGYRFPVHFCAS